MMASGLTCMPTELIIAILKQFTSFQDLYALVTTSSFIYESFRLDQQAILSSVAHNALGPGIFSEAMIGLRSLNPTDTVSKEQSSEANGPINSIIHMIHDEKSKINEHYRMPLTRSIALYRHHRLVESFVQDYVFRHVAKYGGPWLSSLEMYRIRRAFYRYDTFKRAQLVLSQEQPSSSNPKAWSELIKAYAIKPWEIDEVLCVHHYLLERLEGVFDLVEEEFIESALATTKESATLGGGPDEKRGYSEGVAKWSRDHPSHFFEAENPDDDGRDDHLFFYTSEKPSHYLAAEHLATLGLLFLHSILYASDGPSRREMIVRNYTTASVLPLPEVLFTSSPDPFVRSIEDMHECVIVSFGGDAPEKCNLGRLWATHFCPTPTYATPCSTNYRSWGYAFWDRARSEHLGWVTGPCSAFVRELLPEPERRRGEEKSVERRLVEMGLIEDRHELNSSGTSDFSGDMESEGGGGEEEEDDDDEEGEGEGEGEEEEEEDPEAYPLSWR